MHKLPETSVERSVMRVAQAFLPFLKTQSRKLKATRGFTLIETFVAIVILTTALAGALGLAANGFNSADISGDQITASFLAQDGIEFVRYARDSAKLSGQPWLSYLGNCTNGQACYFDASQGLNGSNPKKCSSTSGCPVMWYDDPLGSSCTSTAPCSGFYNYVGGTGAIGNQSVSNNGNNAPSKFTRTVTITTPVTLGSNTNSNEAHVTVTVTWTGRNGRPQAPVVLQEDLYDWQ